MGTEHGVHLGGDRAFAQHGEAVHGARALLERGGHLGGDRAEHVLGAVPGLDRAWHWDDDDDDDDPIGGLHACGRGRSNDLPRHGVGGGGNGDGCSDGRMFNSWFEGSGGMNTKSFASDVIAIAVR